MSSNLSPLKVSGLVKKYGKRTVLKNISLELERGEIFGLIGPEDAGKSTLVRTILNFLHPTAGSIDIFGVDSTIAKRDIMRVVGYLPSDIALYEDMTGKQLLHYLSSLRKNTDREYTNTIAERLNIALDKPIQYLPKGERQKINIIQALMSKPELLILDEPTQHLSHVASQIFYDIIRQLRSDGCTILLVSSNLHEIQRVSQRIGFMRNGELITTRKAGNIDKVNFREYTVRFSAIPSKQELANLPGVASFSSDLNQVRFTITGQVGDFLRELSDYSVVDLESNEVNLENVFMHYYKQSSEEKK